MFRPPAATSKRATAPVQGAEELEPAAAVAAVIARRATLDAPAMAAAAAGADAVAPLPVTPAWTEVSGSGTGTGASTRSSSESVGGGGTSSPGSFRRPPPPTRQAPTAAESQRHASVDGKAEPTTTAVSPTTRTGMQIPAARSERSASEAPMQQSRPRSSMPPPLVGGGGGGVAIPPAPSASANAALSDALQKRFEAEFNRRHQSELQTQAISKQMEVERAEHAAVKSQLAECQRALQLSQTTAAEYAATQARLKQQVAELSSEKAMLASQVLALEEQIEELSIPPPPPTTTAATDQEAPTDTESEPAQQSRPSVLYTGAAPTGATISASPTASTSSSAPSAGDMSMLQARCAHFERLWRVEKAEREALEVAMESRDIAECSTDGDSIRPIHFHSNDSNASSTSNTVVSRYSQQRSRASSGLFVRSEGRPSANSHVEASPVQRQIPDDLEGFDSGDTIRLKAGSGQPPSAAAVFAANASSIAAPVSTTTDGASEPPSPPSSTPSSPSINPSHPSAALSAAAAAHSYLSASPALAPGGGATPAPGRFAPVVALPSSPTGDADASTVVVTELDSGAIASLLSSKYRWSSAVHREYFRREIDEILDNSRDEESVRDDLKQLELQCVAPLQYELVEKIGAGGFGCVYRAVPRPRAGVGAAPNNQTPTSPLSSASSNSVAIKVINLEDSVDDLANICREITAISEGNSCAQLTRYYGSAVLGTKLWIVLEYVDGGSVLDFIKEKRTALEQRALRSLLPGGGGGGVGERSGSVVDSASAASVQALGLEERYIAIIVREVLWALLFLESQKKFHRDLKAANILLSRSTGSVKLADLGASTQLSDTMTKANTMIGSPNWMAPEIMMQEKYDGKADIWSLGITCLEMATGAPPHFGIHPVQVMNLIVASPPPVLEGEHFSKGFKEFVALCLVKDPERRPTLTQLLRHAFIKKARKTAEIKIMMQGGTLR